VVVEYLAGVELPVDEGEDAPTQIVGVREAIRYHRNCNYKLLPNGELVIYPADGYDPRHGESDAGPVGGYARGVWRRYWYEYERDAANVVQRGRENPLPVVEQRPAGAEDLAGRRRLELKLDRRNG
jgi:hypothetical protein